MICIQCQSNQSTTIDHEVICTNCGTVLTEDIGSVHDLTTASNWDAHPFVSEKASTRKEQEFLGCVKRYVGVLGLASSFGDIRTLYYAHRARLSTYKNRYSAEASVSLIYIATRTQHSGQTLAEYGGRLGITDVKKLNKAFTRLNSVIKMPIHEQPTATTRISTVVGKIYEPLKAMMNFGTDAVELVQQGRRVYDIAEKAGLETGRHAYPLLTACIVVAACSFTKNSQPSDLINWDILGNHISYASKTVLARYQELMKILFYHAKSLPWLAGEKMTRTVLQTNLGDIIQVCCSTALGLDSKEPSVHRHPPSFMRNARQMARRSEQISCASEYVKSSGGPELLMLDVETRMIYFLLAKHVPELEIQEMDTHHIYERVCKLYNGKENSVSQEELDDPELTERDMDDNELAQYLKHHVH